MTTAALEALRRSRVSLQQRKERARILDNEPLILTDTFSRLNADELLAHFRGPRKAKFFTEGVQTRTAEVVDAAERIVNDHAIEWRRDPLSNYVWPLDYYRDIKLMRADGSDVRMLWELNRLGHFLTLARAYEATHDERYAVEFIAQLRSWVEQNP